MKLAASQFAPFPGRRSIRPCGSGGQLSEAQALHIAIAQTIQAELAPTDPLNQLAIVRCEGGERSPAPAVQVRGLAKAVEHLVKGGRPHDLGGGSGDLEFLQVDRRLHKAIRASRHVAHESNIR